MLILPSYLLRIKDDRTRDFSHFLLFRSGRRESGLPNRFANAYYFAPEAVR
jgi:hypothetical protein